MKTALSFLICSILGLLISGCWKQNVPIHTEYDFIYLLDHAKITAQNKQFVIPMRHTLKEKTQWAIFSHAPSSITYDNIYVGEKTAFDFSIGLLEKAWTSPGDGVRFQIAACDLSGATYTLFSKYIDPKKNRDERQWNSFRIAVDDIKNTTVSITFSTIPSETDEQVQDNNNDWSVWGNPRLTSSGIEIVTKKRRVKPNVVLVTIDTVRQDYTGLASPWIRTETLKKLAKTGIEFDRAYSNISTTSPSHATILSSLYPFDHGLVSNSFHLPEAIPVLPKIFSEAGYKTGAAISVYHMIDEIAGFGHWFDTYDHLNHSKWLKITSEDLAVLTRSGAATTSASIAWLEEVCNDPFFLWVHLYDPHSPYEAEGDYHKMYYEGDPTHWTHKSMKNVMYHEKLPLGATDWIQPYTDLEYFKKEYAAEITYTDNQLNRLIDALKRLKVYDNTIIVIVADHGENLSDHGIFFDHWTLFNSDIHVPLLIHYPQKLPKGIKVHNMVSLIDVAPTILDIAGMKDNYTAREIFQGQSLRPLWEGKGYDSPRILTADGLLFKEISGWDETYKVTWELREAEYHDELKLHLDRVWIFDVKNDPAETNPIACFYWKAEESRKSNRAKMIERLKPFDDCIDVLEKLTKEHPGWDTRAQIPSVTELTTWFGGYLPQDNAVAVYLKDKDQTPSPKDLQAMLDTEKMDIIIEMTSLRAREKQVPTDEELLQWLENPEDDGFYKKESINDPNFIAHIRQIMTVLKERMVILPMRERLKNVMDITDLEDEDLWSRPMFVGNTAEALANLGYVEN